MAFVRFILASLMTIGLIYVLDHPVKLGENTLPPPGKFFSPQHGFWMNAEPVGIRYPHRDLQLAGLTGEVTLLFDDQMVPHIYAENDLDAAFAQGYVSAMLRLFQMDLSTRAPLGKLSEIMGERTLAYDLGQRRKGILEAAERLAASWEANPEIKPLMQAFTDGVNARIKELNPREWPLEFKLLDYEPEPWTFTKSAGFIMAMSETLARTAHDIPLSNAYQVIGPADFPFLYPNRNPKDIPVIPDSSTFSSTNNSLTQAPTMSASGTWGYQDWLPESVPGIGSNNWVAGQAKTRDHLSILCNDPHLTLTLPSIWLEMQISTPKASSYGVAFPPLVGIAIGFNEHAAWGFTNAGHDVMDWYAIRWTDETKTKYLLDGQEKMAALRTETIVVRGQKDPVLDTVRFTVWGPVPNLIAGTSGADLAMHWIPLLDIDDQMGLAFAKINQANTVAQWLQPLYAYDAPMQNALFATTTGDIALRVSGLLPIRNQTDGRLVQDGSLSEVAWSGFVPDDENPIAINPAQGYLASANQQSTGTSYPYAYNGIFENYRGRYINERLRSNDSLTVEDMMALQSDNTSLFALEAMETFFPLVDTTVLSNQEFIALQSLRAWDGRFEALNNMPLLFDLWQRQVGSLTWDELYTAREQMPVEIPDEWRLLELLQITPDLKWFDIQGTKEVEDGQQVVTLAWKNAFQQFTDLSASGKGYWSAYKSTDIMHLARIPAFSAMDLELGGNKNAINAITSTNGPSWRMIVELGPQIRAFGIFPGGQSGNPGSPYYRNFLSTWQKGEYRSLQIQTREEVMNHTPLMALTLKTN
ncbi:MAG: penicillin acylase family protein [Saprospiraceae bacterium]|nr:penicillin acylase family protein [Saprospiraceae bacterium]